MLAYNLWLFWFFLSGIFFVMGVVYPVFMVIVNKVFFKSKLSVKEILKRI